MYLCRPILVLVLVLKSTLHYFISTLYLYLSTFLQSYLGLRHHWLDEQNAHTVKRQNPRLTKNRDKASLPVATCGTPDCRTQLSHHYGASSTPPWNLWTDYFCVACDQQRVEICKSQGQVTRLNLSLESELSATWRPSRRGTICHCSDWLHVRDINSIIPRLYDQANIEQSSSKHPANAFKIEVHDVCSDCSMFAWWLLHRVNGVWPNIDAFNQRLKTFFFLKFYDLE